MRADLDPSGGIWQQRDRARLLNGGGELPLMPVTGARDSAGNDLSSFRNEVPQHADFFIINKRFLVRAESTHLAA